MLAIDGIDTFYGTSHILHHLSLDVPEAGIMGVLGRNGAGKTTLMRSIIGINPPRRGTIRAGGTDITHMRPHRRAHLGLGYVPQGKDIIYDLSVRENILLALLGKGKKADRVPDDVFGYFPALKEIMDRKGGVLSGGQQQQLAIARVLVQDPTLLLLDEPTEGLQPSIVEEISEIIKRIHRERRCTILLVEQRLDFVRDIAERYAILDTGRLVAQGSIGELGDQVVERYLHV